MSLSESDIVRLDFDHAAACRCSAIMASFGAPYRCGVCVNLDTVGELEKTGWVRVDKTWRKAYVDAGVEVRATLGPIVWAPDWAAAIVDAGDRASQGVLPWLKPVIERAAVDEAFRHACVTILSLSALIDRPEKLGAYAAECGLI